MLEKVREEIIKFNQDRDWDQFHSPENLAKSIEIICVNNILLKLT